MPGDQPARPAEDREPVGPYAPTSGRMRSPLANAVDQIRRENEARRPTISSLVASGLTASAAASHVLSLARIEADRERYRNTQFEQGRRAGLAEHARIVDAEREARDLDGGVVDEWDRIEETTPSAYDVAVEALQVAIRLVEPIKSATLILDEEFGPVTSAYARLTTDLADRFYGWLWLFTDMAGPNQADHPIETCGGCSQPRERHDPGCLYTPRMRKGPMSGPQFDPVLRCPHPQCNAALTAGPESMCTDPWCPSGGAVVGEPVAEVKRCPSCGMSMQNGCSNPQCDAPELVEDDDGAPLPPEQQPCPECRQGKHVNCGGRILCEQDANDPLEDGPLQYRACPCAGQNHPDSLTS